MDRLIFNSIRSVIEEDLSRQRTVNELANVSTIGFKRSFDVAQRSIKIDGPGFDTRFQPQILARDIVELAPGPLMVTGRPLDIAMQGDTVLAVQAPNGERAYTRRGDLRVNVNGVLETGSGHVVLGEQGPINVPPGFSLRINGDGTVFASNPAAAGAVAEQPVGQLALRNAAAVSLSRREDGLYAVVGQPRGADIPVAAGAALPAVTAQSLEGSNVTAVEAMARMMDHARSFEMQVRIIKETKSIDESGTSLMRLG